MRTPAQLPLALSHPPEYGRDSFLPGPSNAAALGLIERWPDWTAPVAVLTGPPGSGKTHLAHIWAERADAGMVQADAIDPAAAPPLPPGGALVVEDVAMDAVPDRPLFHLMNSARELGGALLITSRSPVVDWRIGLPDLASRLRMAVPLALAEPDDVLLRKVLVKLFADRQLIVERAVLDYLIVRMERSLVAAAGIVGALDREALAAGRRITRPMAARVLAATVGEAGEFTGPESSFEGGRGER